MSSPTYDERQHELRAYGGPIMNIDLTTDEGFLALAQQAADAVYARYGSFGAHRAETDDEWNALAGRTLKEVAEEMADEFMQQSVSLARSAFTNPQASGRELKIVRNVYAYIVQDQLRSCISQGLLVRRPLPDARRIGHSPQQPQQPPGGTQAPKKGRGRGTQAQPPSQQPQQPPQQPPRDPWHIPPLGPDVPDETNGDE